MWQSFIEFCFVTKKVENPTRRFAVCFQKVGCEIRAFVVPIVKVGNVVCCSQARVYWSSDKARSGVGENSKGDPPAATQEVLGDSDESF